MKRQDCEFMVELHCDMQTDGSERLGADDVEAVRQLITRPNHNVSSP